MEDDIGRVVDGTSKVLLWVCLVGGDTCMVVLLGNTKHWKEWEGERRYDVRSGRVVKEE